jgi:hypothetical protein
MFAKEAGGCYFVDLPVQIYRIAGYAVGYDLKRVGSDVRLVRFDEGAAQIEQVIAQRWFVLSRQATKRNVSTASGVKRYPLGRLDAPDGGIFREMP